MDHWTPEDGGAPGTLKTELSEIHFDGIADGARTERACQALAASEGFDYDGFFCQGHTLPGTLEALGFLASLAHEKMGEWRAAVVLILSQALAWDETDEVRRQLWASRRALMKVAGIAYTSDDELREQVENADPDDAVGAEVASVLRAIASGDDHECELDVDSISAALDAEA